MLKIDLERELGESFNKKRVHVSLIGVKVMDTTEAILIRLPGPGDSWDEQRLLFQRSKVGRFDSGRS